MKFFPIFFLLIFFVTVESLPGSETKEAPASGTASVHPATWYEPAPIPHGVNRMTVQNCMVCHSNGRMLNGKKAPIIPHDIWLNCQQCHVSPALEANPHPTRATHFQKIGNLYHGFQTVASIPRDDPEDPPAIPHPRQFRENCLTCHGPGSDRNRAVKTPHPERRKCTTCHKVKTGEQTPASAGEPAKK